MQGKRKMADEQKITLAHGSGGSTSYELIRRITRVFGKPAAELNDSAVVGFGKSRLAFTTDSFVVKPVFFPGGDIGKLSVCGTVNDLAVAGAVPLYLTASCIVEEGFKISDFKKIVESMKKAATQAGIRIIGGDLKVVKKGEADGIFVNTAGIGMLRSNVSISVDNAKPGDKVIISGSIGDHGIAILSQRPGISFRTNVKSDCAPLDSLTGIVCRFGKKVRVMRDPTRGGLASALNEIAMASGKTIIIDESAVPVRREVGSACGLLGLDPLQVANEGKLVAVVSGSVAGKICREMKKNRYGKDAAIIGEVFRGKSGVYMKTIAGGKRIVEMLSGEQLPRIC